MTTGSKVKQLQLKKTIFVPGVGTLPTTIGTVHSPAEMFLQTSHVVCTSKGQTFFIPFDMIEAGTLETTPDANPKTSKKV